MKNRLVSVLIGLIGPFLICGATPQEIAGKSHPSIENPDLIQSIKPTIPRALLHTEKEFEVLVEFTITLEGQVRDLQIIESDSPALAASVESAVLQWKFNPKRINGRPVGARVRMPVKFERTPSG